MKRVLLLLFPLLLIGFFANSQEETKPLHADSVLSHSLRIAGKQHKNVLLIFHASWCVWCHRMDSSMNDPSCKRFFDEQYVITHLVVHESGKNKMLENPGAEALKDRYHGKDTGIPFWLIFDPEGRLLADSKIRKPGESPADGENTGCPARPEEVDYFISVLKRTSSLTESQLAIIRARFNRNNE